MTNTRHNDIISSHEEHTGRVVLEGGEGSTRVDRVADAGTDDDGRPAEAFIGSNSRDSTELMNGRLPLLKM